MPAARPSLPGCYRPQTVLVALTNGEVDALLRALDAVRTVELARNRRERPWDLRQEEAVEAKLLAPPCRDAEAPAAPYSWRVSSSAVCGFA